MEKFPLDYDPWREKKQNNNDLIRITAIPVGCGRDGDEEESTSDGYFQHFGRFFELLQRMKWLKGKNGRLFIWRLLLFRDVNPIISSVIEMASLAAVSYQ